MAYVRDADLIKYQSEHVINVLLGFVIAPIWMFTTVQEVHCLQVYFHLEKQTYFLLSLLPRS